MAIKVNKRSKTENLVRFDNLKIGDFFDYDNNLFVKINEIKGEDKNVFCFTRNRLEQFAYNSTLCKIIEGELTYWD